MAERSRDWLEQARRDLENARWNIQGAYYEWACFASQQAAEKALKGVFQRLGATAWGHSVAMLLAGLQEHLKVPEEVLTCGRKLDRFYVPARYPNGWEAGSPKDYYAREDAEDAVSCGEQVLRFCEGVLAQRE